MHTIIGKIIRFFLWLLSSFIILMLLIGLAKFNWNISDYIGFLNARDRKTARWQLTISHPSSLGYVFRGNGSELDSGTILSGDLLTGELLTGEESTWLDAYDPSLETDLNAIPEDELTGNISTDEGFGFTGTEETTSASNSGDDKAQLLNLIRQRELNN